MNRRSFFRSLGIATAALYIRLSPSSVRAIEQSKPFDAPVAAQYDDAFRVYGGHVRYRGRVLTHDQMFEINRLKHAPIREEYLSKCPAWESI